MGGRVLALAVTVAAVFLCIGLTSAAAALALLRPDIEHLQVETGSRLHADYSADPRGARFAPLQPAIVAAAQSDGRALGAMPSAAPQPIDIMRLPTATATAAPADTPTAQPSPTPALPTVTPPRPSTTAGPVTPVAETPTFEPTALPATREPPSATETPPPPTEAPTGTPTFPPRPTNTAIPSATPSPRPTATAAPTSTPPAAATVAPMPTSTATPAPTTTGTSTPMPTNTPTPTPTATGTPTPMPTNTPTPTPTPTPTLTPTPTPTSTTASTGLLNCLANAPVMINSGDNDGYENSPANACTSGNGTAHDNGSGTSAIADCADAGKDRHVFWNYGAAIPAGATVNGIEVRLDANANSSTNSPSICVELSWDGGATWTAPLATSVLGSGMTTFLLGSATNTWGRAWTPAELADANLRVRLTDIAGDSAQGFTLDWVAVNVTYTP